MEINTTKPTKSDSKIEGCKNVCVDDVVPKPFIIFSCMFMKVSRNYEFSRLRTCTNNVHALIVLCYWHCEHKVPMVFRFVHVVKGKSCIVFLGNVQKHHQWLFVVKNNCET